MSRKSIGEFLQSRNSWNRVIKHLRKRLPKYKHWNYTYEFDEGSIQIIINPLERDKVRKADVRKSESKTGEEEASGHKKHRRRRKKQWS